MPTTAGAPPGSGANFKALSAKLAARGATNPGALAAYIGRKKYGRKGFAKLSSHGRSHGHSNTPWATVDLAGSTARCPNCGYESDDADFAVSGGASGTSSPRQPPELQTQARGDWASRAGFTEQSIGVRTASVGLANTGTRALLMANGRPRVPVRNAADIIVSRSGSGTAVIRHRMGGELIGEIGVGEDNAWRSLIDGKELSPHTHQRAALQELIGTWNRTALDPARPTMPLQAPPRQPELLAQLGIGNVRAFASDPDNDGDDDDSSTGDTDNDGAGGLSPRGVAIYKKLMKRGMKMDVARKMAMRAQNFGRKAS